MFFPEHRHIPVSRETDYPDSYGGGVLPDFYKRTYDPFISCRFAAAATTPWRSAPASRCSRSATRCTPRRSRRPWTGSPAAGSRSASASAGTRTSSSPTGRVVDPAPQGREQVELMQETWTQDVAWYDGERVSLPPNWCWPKPVQTRGPPVYLGGSGPVTMRHAAEWADVWYPTPPVADPFLESRSRGSGSWSPRPAGTPRRCRSGVRPARATRGTGGVRTQRGVPRQHRPGRGVAAQMLEQARRPGQDARLRARPGQGP